MQQKKLKITVLRGGPSAERQVSLISGGAVARALRAGGHEVFESDIGPDDLSALDRSADVIFPVLHGTFGEDGQLQAIMERRGLRYVGSDAQASRLAMDKVAAKQAFAGAGLFVAREVFIRQVDFQSENDAWLDRQIESAVKNLGLPCVVKPNFQGSSVGVVIAKSAGHAAEGIRVCLDQYGDCLIEQFIVGRELTVGILGEQTLPVLEIRPAQGFYDYQAKYQAEDTQYLFDMGLSAEDLAGIQKQALVAFKSLGCRDFGRVDVIYDALGRSWLLEVNTIPGFTDHSLLPKAAGRAGISFEELCDRIARMALIRPI